MGFTGVGAGSMSRAGSMSYARAAGSGATKLVQPVRVEPVQVELGLKEERPRQRLVRERSSIPCMNCKARLGGEVDSRV